MPRLPLDAAANAGPLVFIDWLVGESSLNRSTEITTSYRPVVAGPTVVQLSSIREAPLTIKEIEVWSAGSAIGFRNLLSLVVTEGKGKAQA